MGWLSETEYVDVGGSDVAYRVIGEGPLDLLYCFGLGSHVDLARDDPNDAHWLEALASFSRVIFFDRRGTGASDGVVLDPSPIWEEWIDDLTAVLDAVGSERAAIFASLDAGPIAMLFASVHPGRVRALVLANTSARFLADDDYPIGVSQEVVDTQISVIASLWGKPDLLSFINPALAEDREFARAYARRLRASATPRTAAAQYRYVMSSLDIRAVLPSIQTATLVIHTTDNPIVPLAHGRYIADHIAGATFLEVPGHGASLNDGRARTIALDEIFAIPDRGTPGARGRSSAHHHPLHRHHGVDSSRRGDG